MILAALFGCLPHGAATREGEINATRYALITEDGRRGTITQQFVRAFADGSNGWVICWEEESSCAELRAFPTGEIATLRGLESWSAEARKTMFAAWPLLSPHPVTGPDAVTGWPAGPLARATPRVVARGGWAPGAGGVGVWRADLGVVGLSDPAGVGKLDATAVVDRQGLARADWSADLTWCRTGVPCTTWSSHARLDRVGTAPPRRLSPCPQNGEEPARAPLCAPGLAPLADSPLGLDLDSFLGSGSAAPKTATLPSGATP